DRDARRRRGGGTRRSGPMLYFRHRLMLTPQTPLLTAERVRSIRPAGGLRGGPGLSAGAPAAASRVPVPPADPGDPGRWRLDLPGPAPPARRRRVGLRQVTRRRRARAGRILRGGGARPALARRGDPAGRRSRAGADRRTARPARAAVAGFRAAKPGR